MMTSEEIQAALKYSGVTQRQLVQRSGLSESIVSIIIKHMPTLLPHIIQSIGKNPFQSDLPSLDEAIDILDQIASLGGVASIDDPVEWQREMRQDRPLPGRDF